MLAQPDLGRPMLCPTGGVESLECWSQFDQEQFTCGRALFGKDSCKISRYMGSKTCSQVGAAIASDKSVELLRSPEDAAAQVRLRASASRRKRSSRQAQPRKVSRTMTSCPARALQFLRRCKGCARCVPRSRPAFRYEVERVDA